MVNLNLSSLNGANGFIIPGLDEDSRLGDAVSNAGDINGDGIVDILIGAKDADVNDQNSTGKIYVIFGENTNFSPIFNLANLDGNNGFVINGINPEDLAGISVSKAGDINNDGFDDLIIGARGADPDNESNAGESYVVFGTNTGFNSSLDLANLDGNNGFVINGIDGGDLSGTSVSNAGDVNGDDIDDLIIGANFADPNSTSNAGESYVVFGNNDGFGSSLNLANLNGNNGFVINGIDKSDFSGVSVSSAGDINNDGLDDVIIGANFADPNGNKNAGESYLVFGNNTEFNSSLNLANLDGNNGFVINGIDAGDNSGISVSSAGDINGDGFADLIVGAANADPHNQENGGEAYIIFGTDVEFSTNFDLSTLNGRNGFIINGANIDNLLGTSVNGIGDVNGDRLDDVIISAVGANQETGLSYVLFGREEGFKAIVNLADLHPNEGYLIQGMDTGDRSGNSVSGAGDFNDDGINDLIIGAPQANPNNIRNAGESYLIFGQDERSLDIVDFTRGNNQDVNVPELDEQIGISLNNGLGVTQIDFTFSFDSNLLTVDDVILSSSLQAQNWQKTINRDISGQVTVSLTGDALSGGAIDLVSLDANVPGDATYGATNALSIDSIQLNQGEFNVIGDTATHLVAYLGDADGDRAYTMKDAMAISRLVTGIDSEFSAFSGVAPHLVADINSDGIISALDAVLVANVARGLSSSFIPNLPG